MSRSELPPHLYESYMSRSELGLDLHEGFTIQGLPIIPPASLPAEIPVLADCSSHLRAAPLAERAVETIDSYHQGLKLVVQPGDPEVWKASAEVVGQTMKINEVVKKAYEEASELTIELVKRVETFNESVLIRASHFTNGQWLRKCQRCGFPLRLTEVNSISSHAAASAAEAEGIHDSRPRGFCAGRSPLVARCRSRQTT